MTLRLLGVGLPRTGTMSLKVAIGKLTGGTCYHMHEVSGRAGHGELWARVLDGEVELIGEILEGFTGAVDWPVSALWRDMIVRYPEVPVLLSHRGDAETWWDSADKTVWEVMRQPRSAQPEQLWELNVRFRARLGPDWDKADAMKAFYAQHLADVRAAVEPHRLFEYQPGDGWGPICDALGIEKIPTEDFPYLNSRAEFVQRLNR